MLHELYKLVKKILYVTEEKFYANKKLYIL